MGADIRNIRDPGLIGRENIKLLSQVIGGSNVRLAYVMPGLRL